MLISLRKRNIINFLINNPRTLGEISKELNVSTRTVRRDFILINYVLENYDYKIDKVNKAYIIYDSNHNLNKILDANNQMDFNLEEKTLIYLANITKNSDIINVNNISQDLYISLDKVKEDVSKVLLSHNIIFSYKKGVFVVEMTPKEKLKKFNEIIKNYFALHKIEEIILSEDINNVGILKVKDYLNYYFNINDFKEVFNIIQDVFNKNNNYINDQELFDLTIKVLIYIKQKEYVSQLGDFSGVIPNKIAEQIINKLDNVSPKESMCIVNEINNLITEFEIEKIDYNRIGKIQIFLNSFLEKLNFYGINTQSLEYKILLHDKRTELAQNKPMNDKNIKAIDALILKNSKVYEALLEANDEQHLYDFEELKYIFIYCVMEVEKLIINRKYKILFVCSEGVGSSLMIKNQLKLYLPNSNINIVSLTEILRMDLTEVDLVVSLNELPNHIEDIVLGYRINDNDFTNIKNKLLNRVKSKSCENKSGNMLINTFNNQGNSNYESLKDILKMLETKDVIDDANYLFEKLKKREKLGIGIPSSKVAFYHTKSSSIRQGVMYVISTNDFKTLGLDMKNIICNTILLLLMPEEMEQSVIEKINFLSYKLITDDDLMAEIQQQKIEKLKNMIIN